jgi:hypothetical protein
VIWLVAASVVLELRRIFRALALRLTAFGR